MTMNCKYCLAELEEGTVVCPVCGKDLTEEPEAPETPEVPLASEMPESPAAKVNKPKVWKIILAVAGCLVLAAVLTGAVLYGLGIDLTPRENDILFKDSYTVDDATAEKKGDVVVATLGDQKLTNAQLQAFYWPGVYEQLNYYGYYLSMMGFDFAAPLDTQVYDFTTGKTYQQMFLEYALETWQGYAALTQLAQEAGFTLGKEQQDYLDSLEEELLKAAAEKGYADVETFIDRELFPGCSMEAYYGHEYVALTGLAYYDTMYETMMPTQDEIEAYYLANEDDLVYQGFGKDSGNYCDVRHILVKPEGGTTDENGVTTYSEEEWEACLEKAQKLLDEYLQGAATEDAFADLAKTKSEDPGSAADGGLYTQLSKDTNFVEEFKTWYLDESRKPGDTGLVKSVHGYHIMYFSGSEPIWQYETKAAILSEKTNKLLEDAKKAYPMEVNYKKIVLGFVDLNAE